MINRTLVFGQLGYFHFQFEFEFMDFEPGDFVVHFAEPVQKFDVVYLLLDCMYRRVNGRVLLHGLLLASPIQKGFLKPRQNALDVESGTVDGMDYDRVQPGPQVVSLEVEHEIAFLELGVLLF